MNFTPRTKTRLLEKCEKSLYDHDLQLYREIPDIQINLDEFEEWAVERLKGKKRNVTMYLLFFFYHICTFLYSINLLSVLQLLEQLSLKGNTNSYEDFTKSVIQEIKKEGLNHMYKLVCNFIAKKSINHIFA